MSDTDFSKENSRCMGCMEPLPAGRERCGFCGHMAKGENPSLYLPVNSVLIDTYTVGNMLEFGGDCALYIGYDSSQKCKVIIREFFPEQLCTRKANGALAPHMGFEPAFADYFGKFRNQARALAKVRSLNGIISIYDIFEANQTVYTVSEFNGLTTLRDRVEKEGYISWEEFRPLFVPLLTSISTLHAAGILHLGISPQNIIVGTDGKFHLQGFSIEEARRAGTKISPVLESGFASPEQYAAAADIGAWSDVYALGAIAFYALTGVTPQISTKRTEESNDLSIPAKIANEMPQHIAIALLNALNPNMSKRTRTVSKFRDDLTMPPAVTAMQEEKAVYTNPYQVARTPANQSGSSKGGKGQKKGSKKGLLIFLLVGILLTTAVGVILFLTRDQDPPGDEEPTPTTTSTAAVSTTTLPNVEVFDIPSLLTQGFYQLENKTLLNDMRVELGGLVYSDKPFGEIISQSPTPDEMAPAGTVIKVYISGGLETIFVPNLAGAQSDVAVEILQMLGFTVKTEDKESIYSVGSVAEVKEVGQKLRRGSEITVYVSIGKPTETTAR